MEMTQIAGIEFGEDGVRITYIRPLKDIRKNGLLWQHQVVVPFKSDYDDEITALVEATHALLDDVLDDEDRAEPIDPPQEDDDDDD